MHTWNLIVMAYLCRKKGLQATTLSAWKMTLLSWYGKESLLLTNNIITPLFVCAFCFCQQLAKTQYSFSPRGAFHQTEFWLLFYFVGKMHTLKGRRSCREFLIPCTLLPHLGSGRFGHYIHLCLQRQRQGRKVAVCLHIAQRALATCFREAWTKMRPIFIVNWWQNDCHQNKDWRRWQIFKFWAVPKTPVESSLWKTTYHPNNSH